MDEEHILVVYSSHIDIRRPDKPGFEVKSILIGDLFLKNEISISISISILILISISGVLQSNLFEKCVRLEKLCFVETGGFDEINGGPNLAGWECLHS